MGRVDGPAAVQWLSQLPDAATQSRGIEPFPGSGAIR
jgi:hypothetical protein